MDKTTALLALAALGQETRLEVFRLLVRAGAEGVPAGERGAAVRHAASSERTPQ